MRIETDRLVLRPWEERDREPLAAILADPVVRRYYPSALTRAEADAQFNRACQKQRETGFHFSAAELRTDGRFVGLIGLAYIDEALRSDVCGLSPVEIGWQIDKAFWGQGLAPEAAAACLDHGFTSLGLEEIVAYTFAGNTPSRRVMEKIGMIHVPERDFDHPRLPQGHRLRPHVIYSARRTSPDAPL